MTEYDLNPKTASRIFWCVAIVYGIVWTLMPFWFEPNYRYDVLEMFFIGKEGVVATFKHPALNSAILEIAYQASGQNGIVTQLLPQILFLITAWVVWRMGREFLSPLEALFGALAYYGYWGFFYKSLYYNHSTALMPTWAFVTFFAYLALKNGRYRDWIGLGIAIGIGVHCKYSILVLIVAILLFMSLNSRTRKNWFKPGPYLTTFIALIIAAPLIVWMFQSNFSGLKFPTAVHGLEKTLSNRIYAFFNDAMLSVPFFGISFIVLLFPFLGFRLRFRQLSDDQRFGRDFLLGMFAIPWSLLTISCVSAATPMAYRNFFQLFIFLGTILLVTFQIQRTPKTIRFAWIVFGLTMFGYLLGYSMHVYNAYYLSHRKIYYMYPGKQLAEEAEKIWHEKYNQPLPYVTGGWVLAGNVAIYGKDRPTVHGDDHSHELSNGAFPLSNWSTDQEVLKYGGMIFWDEKENRKDLPPIVKERFPSAIPHPPIHLTPKLGKKQPIPVGVAIIPPDDSIDAKPFQPAPCRFY